MKLNIAVVDDNPADNMRLASLLRNWFSAGTHEKGRLDLFSCGEEIISSFSLGKYHIIFMDIIMEGINGIETAGFIREIDIRVLIVFVTASREYYSDAFPLHPFHYILKPYWQKDIDSVMNDAALAILAREPLITIRLSDSERVMPLNHISSVEANGHYTEVITADGTEISSVMPFSEMGKLLAKYPRFIVCSRGIIVNMSRITAMNGKTFTMKEGRVYPISARRFVKVRYAFRQYLLFRISEGS